MSKKETPEKTGETPLHNLFHYQKRKTKRFLRWITVTAIALCVIATGFGLLWYFNASWIALIFAIIFAIIGLGLSGLAFIVGEKIELFNTAASGALNIYDLAQKSSTIVNMEASTNTGTVDIKEIENQPAKLSDAAVHSLRPE